MARETAIKARLIRIGNSQGLRIPKPVVEQCGLVGEVELRVRGKTLVVVPAHRPRKNWDKAFAAMARQHDDAPLLPDTARHDWDETEWRW